MSNFSGVTFPFQKVTPSDDAIVRRAVITDGILSGCKLTYAGTGLTMEAGNLLICGRQIRHGVTETWDFGGATSGYARLVLTIDATKTSTLDAFDMVDASVEYATAEDGFYSLIQEDINVSGTKYQATVCIVSLTDGGINAIVQQLPAAAAKGAGGLNFKVVGGTTRPADPEENTIWVNTDIPITNVIISNAEPSEYDRGTVWIKTSFNSYGYLNIAPEGMVKLYPVKCYQYISNTGYSKYLQTAETFRNGKWRDWDSYLYKQGDMCSELTRGWVKIYPNYSYTKFYEDRIQINVPGGIKTEYQGIRTDRFVDFKYIQKLIMNSDWIVKLGLSMNVRVCLGTTHPDYDPNWETHLIQVFNAASYDGNYGYEIDVSARNGEYIVYVFVRSSDKESTSTAVTINQIKIEQLEANVG